MPRLSTTFARIHYTTEHNALGMVKHNALNLISHFSMLNDLKVIRYLIRSDTQN